jgi:dihydroorotase
LTGWPAVAEEAIIARDVLLAHHVGSRLHICHVSTAGSVDIVRWAKSRAISVTAEVTPHHLYFDDEVIASYNPIFKVNPPLRSAQDVAAVRSGLADGTIDIVATDHAPHPAENKDCEWQAAAFGMTGLESALAIVNETMVMTGLLTWAQVADRMSAAPARIARLSSQGQPIAIGSPAHLVIFDPAAAVKVDPAASVSASRNTPYGGRTLRGNVRHTFYAGKPTVLDGVVRG